MNGGRFSRQNYSNAALYIGIVALFFAAVIVGMTTPMPEEEIALEQARLYIGNYLEALPTAQIKGLQETLSNLLLNALLLILLALGGTHILGAPLILTVLFIKGMSVGYGVAFLLQFQGLAGGELILLALLPPNLILLPVLFRGTAVALRLSTTLLRRRLMPGFSWQNYIGIYAKLLLGVMLSSLLHGYVTPWILRLWFIII